MLNSFEEVRAASQARRGRRTPGAVGAAVRRRGGRAALAVLAAAALVAACGGGGGGGSDGVPVLGTGEFRLHENYRKLLETGSDQRFNVDYAVKVEPEKDPVTQRDVFVPFNPPLLCKGTARLVNDPARDATFEERRPSKAVTFRDDFEAPSCVSPRSGKQVVPPDSSGTRHFDRTSYGILGSEDTRGYTRHELPPGMPGSSPGPLHAVVLPEVVRVGMSGTLGTQVSYANATLANRQGQTNLSYRVEADTAVSMLVILTAETFDNAGNRFSTQIDIYRLTPTSSTPLVLVRRLVDNPLLQLVLTPA